MLENFKFNKKFGQNFLSDRNLLDAIVSDAEITDSTEVLEIGAGAGALTESLVKKAKKVVSYEIDKNLTEHLKDLELKHANLKIYMQDALKTPLEKIEKDFSGEYKLVANLPYYITTPLIFKFLEESDKCKSLTVMVQKEVAERFCASIKSKDYGISTVMMSFYATAKITRNVSRKMFYPVPNVDSAIIKITKKDISSEVDKTKFKQVVQTAFSMRRKTLVNNLSKLKSKEEILTILNKLKINSSARAEELSLNDFIELSKLF